MSTETLGGGVGSFGDVNCTVIDQEIVGVFHPGAIATIATVKLAEQISVSLHEVSLHVGFVVDITVGTVHQVLLGEVLSVANTTLLGEGALNSGGDSKLDAGTALALVLNGTHEAIGGVIDGRGSDDETTTIAAVVASLASEELLFLALIKILQASHGLKLSFAHVTGEVHLHSESTGVAALSCLSVVLVDQLSGALESFETFDKLIFVVVVLVELTLEVEEGAVIAELAVGDDLVM